MRVAVAAQLIVAIEPLEGDTIECRSATGETYELNGDAFAVLTGRDWQDLIPEDA